MQINSFEVDRLLRQKKQLDLQGVPKNETTFCTHIFKTPKLTFVMTVN